MTTATLTPGVYGEMLFEKDVRIPVRGGTYVSANVFRPTAPGTYPVLTSWGPYGKDLPMSEADPFESRLCEEQGPFMSYERFHAPTWVNQGYVVIHIDSTGIGQSPGYLDPFSRRDLEYYHDAIEWAGVQEWSSGKVASVGLSYHSSTSVGVATLRPPHLAAIIPWEVGHDLYREGSYQGGILGNNFVDWWWRIWVLRVQHGIGTLTDEQLAANRIDWEGVTREHPFIDDWWRDRVADITQIEVPFLTVANWSGHSTSLESHFELFNGTASNNKWLRVINGKHVKPMYDAESRAVQKRFLDHFLKGVDNGWELEPPISMQVRGRFGTTWRNENEWPLARTEWTSLYLGAQAQTLSHELPQDDATVTYHAESEDAMWIPAGTYQQYLANLALEQGREGSSVTFTSQPFAAETEITGPLSLKLFVSLIDATDTDIFVTVRYFSAEGHEVVFDGILDSPALPVTVGMLRLSHRELDEQKSTPYHPVYKHESASPVEPGVITELDLEIRPTSVVIEKGGRLAVEVGSRNGVGTFCYLNNDPIERRTGGAVVIHTGPQWPSALLAPVVPV